MKTNTQILSIRKINGGKFSVAFAQNVITPKTQLNLLALANEGDERFEKNAPKATLAWMSFTDKGLLSVLNIDASKLTFTANEKGHLVAIINTEAPKVAELDFNIQINETVGPKTNKAGEFDAVNNRKKVIIDGVEQLFKKDGALVYRYTTVVAGEAKHTLVEGATMIPTEEYEFNMALISEASDNLMN